MQTISKQTEAQKIINNNLLKTEVKNIFTNYYFVDGFFYIPLDDEKTKINNIKALKNCACYLLNLVQLVYRINCE